jgi:hypothetical protein
MRPGPACNRTASFLLFFLAQMVWYLNSLAEPFTDRVMSAKEEVQILIPDVVLMVL